LDWVLAEFVRISHGIPANQAQNIVDDLVTRRSPAIQDFDGFLKVLTPTLRAGDYCLLLLYQCGSLGADYVALVEWARSSMRGHLRRTLRDLVESGFVHQAGDHYSITIAGQREAERKGIVEPD